LVAVARFCIGVLNGFGKLLAEASRQPLNTDEFGEP